MDGLSFIPQITRRRLALERKGLSQEAVYTVLDPRGYEPEVEYQGLTPRLDTLEGKKVAVVNLGGGNEEVMESIAPDLGAAVPGCDAEYLLTSHMGRMEELWDFVESCDAVILGHNY